MAFYHIQTNWKRYASACVIAPHQTAYKFHCIWHYVSFNYCLCWMCCLSLSISCMCDLCNTSTTFSQQFRTYVTKLSDLLVWFCFFCKWSHFLPFHKSYICSACLLFVIFIDLSTTTTITTHFPLSLPFVAIINIIVQFSNKSSWFHHNSQT